MYWKISKPMKAVFDQKHCQESGWTHIKSETTRRELADAAQGNTRCVIIKEIVGSKSFKCERAYFGKDCRCRSSQRQRKAAEAFPFRKNTHSSVQKNVLKRIKECPGVNEERAVSRQIIIGADIEICNEDEFMEKESVPAGFYCHDGSYQDLGKKVAIKLEKEGKTVINSGWGIENCFRKNNDQCIAGGSIPYPPSHVVSTTSDITEVFKKLFKGKVSG
ncbi:hypothetical protein FQR65_LT17116 [Abscondita terminalis]|nr:hypothetical protein FQR65_LT17116 [Abscondita terminalis]